MVPAQLFRRVIALSLLCVAMIPVHAQTAAEKAFMDAFSKAYESGDERALDGFLYTKGADKDMIDMFGIMLSLGTGKRVTSIAIQPLTAADRKKIDEMTGPNGKPVKSPLPLTKKVIIRQEAKSSRGSSDSTTTIFLAEDNGKIVIPVPRATP